MTVFRLTHRFSNIDFREYLENRIREELPAHILARVCWVGYRENYPTTNENDMEEFEEAYREFLFSKTGIGQTQDEEKLIRLIKKMSRLNNIYPHGRLMDCDDEEEELKGRIVLGEPTRKYLINSIMVPKLQEIRTNTILSSTIRCNCGTIKRVHTYFDHQERYHGFTDWGRHYLWLAIMEVSKWHYPYKGRHNNRWRPTYTERACWEAHEKYPWLISPLLTIASLMTNRLNTLFHTRRELWSYGNCFERNWWLSALEIWLT